MAKFHVRNEVVFRAPTRVGLLADVADSLVGHGVNMLAIRGYEEGDTGVMLIYPDDSRMAEEGLAGVEGTVTVLPVIVAEVANRPGQLAEIARTLSNANIDIVQMHATVAPGCEHAMIILQTSDDVAAIDALQKM